MIGGNKERWREVCEQASIEQGTDKLLNLVREINRLLEQKQPRLNRNRKPED